jgi:uncharacterized protein
MPPLVIVDTNIVVAGLITARAATPSAFPLVRILDGMLTATFPYAISEPLLAEYAVVLRRPSLCKVHGLKPDEIDTILVELAQHAILLEPKSASPAPDPGDQHLWELLAARAETVLITGDKLLFQDRQMKGRVILPASFIESWAP